MRCITICASHFFNRSENMLHNDLSPLGGTRLKIWRTDGGSCLSIFIVTTLWRDRLVIMLTTDSFPLFNQRTKLVQMWSHVACEQLRDCWEWSWLHMGKTMRNTREVWRGLNHKVRGHNWANHFICFLTIPTDCPDSSHFFSPQVLAPNHHPALSSSIAPPKT